MNLLTASVDHITMYKDISNNGVEPGIQPTSIFNRSGCD